MAANNNWSPDDAAELYRLDAWSDGFFVVNELGHVAVKPFENDALTIDITDVVAEARRRDIKFPLLLRFQDVLRARVRRLNEAFAEAIDYTKYKNVYRGVYPIKVNQLHEVVEEVLDAGAPYGLGLECGSKAELIASLPHLVSDETLLICNGVKDRTMLSLIIAAQKLGKNVVPVMEKFGEFEQLMALAAESDGKTQFGVRIRLRTGGAGKWADSGGYRSKFGISLPELIEVVERLEQENASDAFILLHFHLGSQISDIQQLKQAAKEMAQIYAELINRGMPIRYMDVGGGLGVNYSGGSDGGINYSLQEYANAVVSAIMEVCDARKVPHPTLVSESGRALTAHHSVLIVEALGAYQKDRVDDDYIAPAGAHRMSRTLSEILQSLRAASDGEMEVSELLEAYHDIVEIHREASTLFGMGYLSLEENALIERLYWSNCSAVLRHLRAADPDPVPAEMRELEDKLVDQYLCDFSVFQSMLDHWAIDQAFPIMPLDRLDTEPTRRALLVDLTCDSDGKVSQYVSSNPDKQFLELHPIQPGEPYFLGFFLMGAYQDIMGDAHNLFGRVAEMHIYGDAEEEGNFWVEKVIPGTEVQEILAQVQYFPNDLQRRMQNLIKEKIESGAIRPKRGMEILDQYMACFKDQTYIDPRPRQ
ncbi:MAG: biosynthetic arginine decarboxylase [Gammaproteobacteria bacterium]|nr:biosynthetic arginine decarboxylase [Gammaproteobacteria bacterium]MDH4314886.1 biosynthetic arginine decarboxylase [Gammaproteobacteria bacterium]MDH5213798.1 biosynthetic arginine decarboxylase [Gammaproteobacteria bacterium]MDH5500029.1 biosynthetic arginine decarboxylase [Gammaproteobacteria bacterium]